MTERANLDEIKDIIKKECQESQFIKNWFYSVHLLGVEKFAKKLLEKKPEADKVVVMLGVWSHDLQRIRGVEGDHAEMGAIEAQKVLKQFDYPEETIKKVSEIILSHSCNTELMPKTLEGKILASADAMAHYINDFYLVIGTTGERNSEEFKEWALEKLDRDYNKKIFFDFAKEMIEKRHKALLKVFTMN